MKKIISVIIAVSLCAGVLFLLSSCGSDVSKSEFKVMEEAFDKVNFTVILDKDNLSVFSFDGQTEESDNTIYVDETDKASFIYNNEKDKTVVVGYIIRDAYYKDIDNDGYEEIYVTGYYDGMNKTVVSLYDYTPGLLIGEDGNFNDTMEMVATAEFEGDENIGFIEDDEGNIHIVTKDKTTGEVAVDYGIATRNGTLLEIGTYNNLSEETEKEDNSIFVTDKYTFYYNGEEFKPEADFAYGEEDVMPPITYIDKAAFEELTGQSYKSLGEELDSRSIMIINGKEYVSWYTLTSTYEINRIMKDNLTKVIFTTLDYSEETTTAKGE